MHVHTWSTHTQELAGIAHILPPNNYFTKKQNLYFTSYHNLPVFIFHRLFRPRRGSLPPVRYLCKLFTLLTIISLIGLRVPWYCPQSLYCMTWWCHIQDTNDVTVIYSNLDTDHGQTYLDYLMTSQKPPMSHPGHDWHHCDNSDLGSRPRCVAQAP